MLAKNLRYLRKSKGLKQDEMPNFIEGLAKSAWSDYEREKARPPLNVLANILEYFRVDFKDIIFSDLEKIGFNVEDKGDLGNKHVTPKDDSIDKSILNNLIETLNYTISLQKDKIENLTDELYNLKKGIKRQQAIPNKHSSSFAQVAEEQEGYGK